MSFTCIAGCTLIGMSNLAPKESSFKQRVSDRYPFEVVRLYMKEYVGEPPYLQTKVLSTLILILLKN